MRLDCVCEHGAGQHQRLNTPLLIRSGTVDYYESSNDAPVLCCACDCRTYRPRLSRWKHRHSRARKYCWIDDNNKPVCGKPTTIPADIELRFLPWTPKPYVRCVACARIVATGRLDLPRSNLSGAV